ncbi:MAG: gamma-glutamylcyclotransferase family protein [Gemmatimonadaceae bacterium]
MAAEPTYLFVYGSLRRDAAGRHHPLLSDAEFVDTATARGRLFRVSWHPGMVPDGSAGPTVGEVFRIPPELHEEMFRALDAYEGREFALRGVTATLASGASVAAHLYAWLGDPLTGTLLPGGDFGTPAVHPDR